MKNPYDVLEVSPNAGDDEIKKAYRRLSRKYHPDANINNPNKAEAEEKFKEVQQAYDAIINRKTAGDFSGFSYDTGYSGGYSGGYSEGFRQGDEHERSLFVAAANYIRNGMYAQALRVLDEIKLRDGRWYYFGAAAMAGMGNRATAISYIKTAMEMEPGNVEYRRLYSQLTSTQEWYANMGNFYGRPVADTDSMYCDLCLMNLFCNLCCC